MIPQIVVSHNLQKQEEYVAEFVKKNDVDQYHLYKISPLKTEITIDQIRQIKKEIITTSNKIRVFVCYCFDTANLEAQNAFLKTLEEKNVQNQFILLAKNLERLLPTIRSRSAIHQLDLGQSQSSLNDITRKFIERVIRSEQYEFFSDAELMGMTRENAEVLFDKCILYIRDLCRENKAEYTGVMKKILHTKSLLLNNNLNPQLAVDTVMILLKQAVKRT